MKSKNYLFFVVILMIAGSCAYSQPKSPVIIPEFTFFKLDDSPFTKRQLSATDKSIFIYFDPSCEHCQAEIESIGKHYTEFKGVSFYLVSANEKAQIGKFMETFAKQLKGKKNVMFLFDRDMVYLNKFMPTQYPDITIYTTKGRLIKHFSGTTKLADLLKASNQPY